MNRKIRFTNFGLLLITAYFIASCALDAFILYKIVVVFDQASHWTLGLSALIIGKKKWVAIFGLTGLTIFHFFFAMFTNSLRIRKADLETSIQQ